MVFFVIEYPSCLRWRSFRHCSEMFKITIHLVQSRRCGPKLDLRHSGPPWSPGPTLAHITELPQRQVLLCQSRYPSTSLQPCSTAIRRVPGVTKLVSLMSGVMFADDARRRGVSESNRIAFTIRSNLVPQRTSQNCYQCRTQCTRQLIDKSPTDLVDLARKNR